MIKRRFKDLVLQDQALVSAQLGIDLLQGVGKPVLAAADIGLTGIVRAIGQPDLEVPRAGLPMISMHCRW